MKPDKFVQDWYNNILNWVDPGFNAHDFDHNFIDNEFIENKDVLNLGCFFPRIEMYYAHMASSWVSIDFSKEVIERCKSFNLTANFIEMDMRKLEFQDVCFDTVLDLSSGDHLLLDDYLLVLDEVKRVLKPGGHFVVTYANLDHFDKSEELGLYGYERRIHSKELKEILESKQFKIIRENSKFQRSGLLCQNTLL